MFKAKCTRFVAVLLVITVLMSVNSFGTMMSSATGEDTNLLLGNMTGKIVYLNHTLDWTAPAPFTYSAGDMSIGNSVGSAMQMGWDSTWSQKGQSVFTDGAIDSFVDGTDGFNYSIDNANGMAMKTRRLGVLYDLGGLYDLNKINVDSYAGAISASRYILNFSVYAGVTADATLLDNRIGFGGGKNMVESADLGSNSSARYILITFDKMGSDPWGTLGQEGHDTDNIPTAGAEAYCGWSDGGLYLSEIELFGTAAVITPTSILQGNMSGKIVHLTHTLNWAEQAPFTYPANSLAIGDQMSKAMTYSSWTTGQGVYTDGYINSFATGTVDDYALDNKNNMLTSRIGILYDLGGSYDLNKINLDLCDAAINAYRYVLNFSVYAGAAADGTLLDNRIGYGGGNGVIESADLTNASSVRYVMIVFDKLGTDTWCTKQDISHDSSCVPAAGVPNETLCPYSDGGVYLSEIELFGDKAAGPSNVLLNNTTGTTVHLTHTLDWSAPAPFTYSSGDMNIGGAMSDGMEYGWRDKGQAVYTDGVKESFTEGTVDNFAIDNSGSMKTSRIGLLFDLGGLYDLSKINLYSFSDAISAKRYILNFSVYAGAAADGTLLANRIGYGGGKDIVESADLTSSSSVRYILITFDKMGSDPWCTLDHQSHDANCIPATGAEAYCVYSNGAVYLSEIELIGLEAVNLGSYMNKQGILSNIQYKTKTEQFISNINTSGQSYTFIDANQKPLTTADYIGTGTTIKIKVNGITTQYTSVVYGDVDGDGIINLEDLTKIRDYILGIGTISDTFKSAGDLYSENDITLNSLVGVMSYISQSGTINQAH